MDAALCNDTWTLIGRFAAWSGAPRALSSTSRRLRRLFMDRGVSAAVRSTPGARAMRRMMNERCPRRVDLLWACPERGPPALGDRWPAVCALRLRTTADCLPAALSGLAGCEHLRRLELDIAPGRPARRIPPPSRPPAPAVLAVRLRTADGVDAAAALRLLADALTWVDPGRLMNVSLDVAETPLGAGELASLLGDVLLTAPRVDFVRIVATGTPLDGPPYGTRREDHFVNAVALAYVGPARPALAVALVCGTGVYYSEASH